MDQKWIPILVILVLCQKFTSGADESKIVKEGEAIEIKCDPKTTGGSMIVWFRALDKSGTEFIGSFSSKGLPKTLNGNYHRIFLDKKLDTPTLTLKSFKKAEDSGVYCCGTVKGNELIFGPATRLLGEEKIEVTTRASPTCTTQPNPTTTACVCKDKSKPGATSPSLFCTPIIMGPLAGGCGLLLLLLIITILYCNRIRTRRCPHHNKRKLRVVAPEKQMMTNRHV